MFRTDESFITRLNNLKTKYLLPNNSLATRMIININNWIRDIKIDIQQKNYQEAMDEYIKGREL